MRKRQEKPYTVRVACMSNQQLVQEIVRHLTEMKIGESSPDLEICIYEDNISRGGQCYTEAVSLFNERMGYRLVGPNALDCRVGS